MVVETLKALADDNRLRIVAALDGRELCVCQLTELLSLATSTVSQHIAILRRAGVLASRKHGRWVFYRLNTDKAVPQFAGVVRWVLDSAAALPHAKADQRRLQEILKTDPEVLCRRQNRS